MLLVISRRRGTRYVRSHRLRATEDRAASTANQPTGVAVHRSRGRRRRRRARCRCSARCGASCAGWLDADRATRVASTAGLTATRPDRRISSGSSQRADRGSVRPSTARKNGENARAARPKKRRRPHPEKRQAAAVSRRQQPFLRVAAHHVRVEVRNGREPDRARMRVVGDEQRRACAQRRAGSRRTGRTPAAESPASSPRWRSRRPAWSP